jgi:hypothetical protein
MVGIKPKLSEKEKFLNKMKGLEHVPNNPSPEVESAYVGSNAKFKAYIPYFLYKPPFGYPRPSLKYMEVKKLANTPYIFGAIKAIRDRIKSMDWDIVPKDGVELTDSLKEKALHIKEWFNNPNGNYESWVDIQDMIVNDMLIYDAGVGVKVFNEQGQMQQFFARAGATFLKNPDIYGYLGNRKDIVDVDNNLVGRKVQSNDSTVANQFKLKYSEEAAYFQYGWTPGVMPVPFGKREIVYVNINPRTDSVYGTSPIGILREIILTLIYGSRYHLDMYINSNIPQGIIGLLGANKEQIRSFRQRMDSNILEEDEFDNWRKKNFKIPIVGGKDIDKVTWTPWQVPSKDMNILSQQQWFQKIVWQCYSEDTEILTENGWKYFKDLNKKEKVARINPNSLEMDYVLPINYQKYKHNKEMIVFKTRNIDLKVTPTHRVLYTTTHRRNHNLPNVQCKAEEIFNKDIEMLQAANFKGTKIPIQSFGDLKFTGEQFCKFMGFWLGDGCVYHNSKDNRIVLSICKDCYPEVYKKITTLLKEINIDYSERITPPRNKPRKTHKHIIGKNNMHDLRFSNKALKEYLLQFGYAKDKYVPQIIKNSTSKEVACFLDYYELADGSKEKYGQNRRFFSMSKQLIDDVQEILFKQGIASNVTKNNGGYNLTERKSKTNKFDKKNYSLIRKNNIKKENYNGFVYDVTLPKYHYLVVRRNGRVCISGNCLGVNSNEMGVTESVNKMTAENQSEILNKRALKPILMKLQYAWNNQIMPELDDTGDLMFKYNDYDIKEDHEKAELYEKKLNYMTVNEIRELEDLEPIEGGDKLSGSNPFGGGFDNYSQEHDEDSYFNKDEDEESPVQDNEQDKPQDKPKKDSKEDKDKLEITTKSKEEKDPEPADSFYGDLAGEDLEKQLKDFYSDLEKEITEKVKGLD